MTEMVLNTNTLPEPLIKLIRSEKVRVREKDGEVRLIPVKESAGCPLIGIASDSSLTVDKFLAITHDRMEMEE